MFAVITTGGKQYIVREGDMLKIEKIEQEVGSPLEFGTLLVAEEDGSAVAVGKPSVTGAKVQATILEQGRNDKVMVVKFKSKVRYRRKGSHRQPFTNIKIGKITQ